ncbi:hypothetical protein NIES2111_61920 (plasmid) [Nostoc sp. NIES-2111]|nr:hypothetical protein NIES2111_61920 [Nostoc sp. NIES-2111]
MPQVEKLKIFLASPGDVKTERNYVFKVVDELNRTVASYKGIVLEVICSENAYPGYGKDGQAIINEQIGKMSDYVLFIGIMWNRIGTPTKRATSGTLEEFKRARRTFRRINQPEIWFYFRSISQGIKTKNELEQQKKVQRFKNSFSKNEWGLFREYKNPIDFCNKLRVHITSWLNDRSKKRVRKSSLSTKQKNIVSSEKTSIDTIKNSNKNKQVSLNSNIKQKKGLSSSRKSNQTVISQAKKSKSISNSGAWVLLNEYLFESELVKSNANNLVLNIPVKSTEQEADLQQIQFLSHHYNRKSIIYAYQNDACMVQIESVETTSVKGKTSYIIILKQNPHSSSYNNFNYYGYNHKQISELQIRLLLLNEIPKTGDRVHQSTLNYIMQGNDYPIKLKDYTIANIWEKRIADPQMFLINARLAVVAALKINNIVKHILELKISFISKNIISINFHAQIQENNSDQGMSIIQIRDKCVLNF